MDVKGIINSSGDAAGESGSNSTVIKVVKWVTDANNLNKEQRRKVERLLPPMMKKGRIRVRRYWDMWVTC